jgi:hypothetical protein
MSKEAGRRVSKRAAAVRAIGKIKETFENDIHWEEKDRRDLKSEKVSNKGIKRERAENPLDDVTMKDADDRSSAGGTVASHSSNSSEASFYDYSSEASVGSEQGFMPDVQDIERMERERKAIRRRQHSGRAMFLSRRFSREIRRKSTSPMSPIVATVLPFSPELKLASTTVNKTEKNYCKKRRM